jgi:hypothetical protein
MVGIEADAEARAAVHSEALPGERRPERGANAFADDAGRVGRTSVSSSTTNSSPPTARDRVDLADARANARGGLAQDVVARGVAEGIVHLLEAVEVDEQQRDAIAAAIDAQDRVLEPRGERVAIRQPGERIVDGSLAQLLFRVHARGDVLGEATGSRRGARLVEECGVVPFAPDRAPVARELRTSIGCASSARRSARA